MLTIPDSTFQYLEIELTKTDAAKGEYRLAILGLMVDLANGQGANTPVEETEDDF